MIFNRRKVLIISKFFNFKNYKISKYYKNLKFKKKINKQQI